MEKMSKAQREDIILNYIYDYAYTKSSDAFIYLRNITYTGTSEYGTKNMLDEFVEKELLAFKLLPNKEKIYYLTKSGVEATGRESSYCKRIKKNLNIKHIEHFWIAKKFEESIQGDTEIFESFYAETLNEFTDEEGKLSVKNCNLRSDAEIIIKNAFEERLAIRVEIDMGTQSISTVLKMKLNNYANYYKTPRIFQEYETFPVYTLFVTNRSENIIEKLKKHEVMKYIIFLPIDRFKSFLISFKFQNQLDEMRCNSELRKEIQRMSKKHIKKSYILSADSIIEVLEKEKKWIIADKDITLQIMSYNNKNLIVQNITNIFATNIVSNYEGQKFSFKSLIEERKNLLKFKNAIDTAGKTQDAYEIVCKTIYSTEYQRDPFFPTFMHIGKIHTKFEPHGYLKLRKKEPRALRDSLFVLIFSLSNAEKVKEMFHLYEAFLSSKSQMEKMNALPIYYGLVVICKKDQFDNLKNILGDYKFLQNCVRIIFLNNCCADEIFGEVWMGLDGEVAELIKPMDLGDKR